MNSLFAIQIENKTNDTFNIICPITGIQGDHGPSGAEGIPGIDGEEGIDGSTGMKGSRGEAGRGILMGEWGEQGKSSDTRCLVTINDNQLYKSDKAHFFLQKYVVLIDLNCVIVIR